MKVSTGLTAAHNKRYNSNDECKSIFLDKKFFSLATTVENDRVGLTFRAMLKED